jgi:hypothetical protein
MESPSQGPARCYVRRVALLEELAAAVAELGAAGVEHALVGRLAVAVWGAPRATQDIDLPPRAAGGLAGRARRGGAPR